MQAWVVPGLLGAATFAALLGLVHLAPAAPPQPLLVPTFPHVAVDAAAPGTLLAVWNGSAGSPFVAAPVAAAGAVLSGDRVLAVAEDAAPGPRFGRAGADSAVLAFYAFTADGRLLATDAPPQDAARFPHHPDLVRVEPAAWHLGDGPAPNGTAPFPRSLAGLLSSLRAALDGQPAGGVAVLRVATEDYGEVVVALRVERLVAP